MKGKGKENVGLLLKRHHWAKLWGLINKHGKKKNDSYNNLTMKIGQVI